MPYASIEKRREYQRKWRKEHPDLNRKYKNKHYEAQKKYNAILNEKEELFAKTQPQAVKVTGEKTARLSNYSRSQVFNILKEIRKNLK